MTSDELENATVIDTTVGSDVVADEDTPKKEKKDKKEKKEKKKEKKSEEEKEPKPIRQVKKQKNGYIKKSY